MLSFLENKTSATVSATIVALVAVAYGVSFSLTASLGLWAVVADCFIVAVLLSGCGMALWNIMRYVPRTATGYGNAVMLIIGFAFVVAIAGTESIVAYYLTDDFSSFTVTLPARGLVLASVYCIEVLYFGRELANAEQESADNLELAPETYQPSATNEVDPIDKITVRNGQKISVVDIADINFIKAEGDYVMIATDSGHWLKEQTMKYYEQGLPSASFARIHRSYIVNVGKITRIERYGQQQQIELANGEKLKVSSSGYKILKERLKL